MKENFTKMLARYYSDLQENIVVETFWVEVIDEKKGLYKIDNIPFYGPDFSAGDIVFAEYDKDEEFLTFRKVITESGNSTIQIIILKEDFDVSSFITRVMENGAEIEKFHDQFLVCNLLRKTNYKDFEKFLKKFEENGDIAFAVPNISKKHHKETGK